jgi:hypothetical protein
LCLRRVFEMLVAQLPSTERILAPDKRWTKVVVVVVVVVAVVVGQKACGEQARCSV